MITTQKDKMTMNESDDLQAHYEFDYSKAKPNRFAERINQESVVVVLDPDVADVFPTSESVNETLRTLMAALQNMSPAKPNREQATTPA